LVSDESLPKFPRVSIPEADGFVPTPSGKDTTISTEGDAHNNIRMPSNGFEMLTRDRVP
jgi:hypothetical protein